jgi:hypothetical protein
MGYTQSWKYSDEANPDLALAVAQAAHEMLTHPAVIKVIETAPEDTYHLFCASTIEDARANFSQVVRFDGAGENTCEPFALELGPHAEGIDGMGNFCKTRREPYDTAVVMVLALALEAGLLSKASADGGWDYDLSQPRALFQKALGEIAPYCDTYTIPLDAACEAYELGHNKLAGMLDVLPGARTDWSAIAGIRGPNRMIGAL